MARRHLLLNTIREVVMWIMSLIIIVPMLMLLLNSVKDVTESAVFNYKLPSTVHFDNFLTILRGDRMFRSFLNSLFMSTVAGFVTLIVSSMAAFVLCRNRTRLNRLLYSICIVGLIVPINFITTMKVLQVLHLINSFTGIILLYSAIFIPFTIFLFYGFIDNMPRDMDESAVIDGAGGTRLFFSIIFPLLKPVSVTACILNFLNCWNDFVMPLYFLNSSHKWGMIMTMYNYFSQFQSKWNLVSASIIVNLIPILTVYFIGQKYIIAGMTTGAVKG